MFPGAIPNPAQHDPQPKQGPDSASWHCCDDPLRPGIRSPFARLLPVPGSLDLRIVYISLSQAVYPFCIRIEDSLVRLGSEDFSSEIWP